MEWEQPNSALVVLTWDWPPQTICSDIVGFCLSRREELWGAPISPAGGGKDKEGNQLSSVQGERVQPSKGRPFLQARPKMQ